MSDLRIFSYLPNPRVWKATIVGRLSGVAVDVRGTAPGELADWLWDFDAHPMSESEKSALSALARAGRVGLTSTLYKTETFLRTQPFGNVPAAFSPDGEIGVFESNSIMRAVARLGDQRTPGRTDSLYGKDPYVASRIDSFLDLTLLFARDVQIYVLALRGGTISADIHGAMAGTLASYLAGIDRALTNEGDYLVGNHLTLADICFFCEMALLQNERLHHALLTKNDLAPLLSAEAETAYPRPFAHFAYLAAHEAIAPDAEDYLKHLSVTAKTR